MTSLLSVGLSALLLAGLLLARRLLTVLYLLMTGLHRLLAALAPTLVAGLLATLLARLGLLLVPYLTSLLFPLLDVASPLLATPRLAAVTAAQLAVLLSRASAFGFLAPLLTLLATLPVTLLAGALLAARVLALAATLAGLLPALLRAHSWLLSTALLARLPVSVMLFSPALLPLELAGFRGALLLRGPLATARLSTVMTRVSALFALPVSVSITS